MSEVQLSKTVMIIKVNKTSLVSAEQFLRNREWSVFSTTSLKDALTYVVQNKPQFVMVCVDHPNKKVRTLPKLLSQAFPVCVIAFAEQSTSQSYRLLLDSQTEYRINPPVTGPAIERAVNKYIRDQEKAALASKEAISESGAEDEGDTTGEGKTKLKGSQGSHVITFKGEGHHSKGSDAFSLDKMNQILGSLGGGEESQEAEDDGASHSGGSSRIQGPAYMPSHNDPKKEGQLIDLSQPQKKGGGSLPPSTEYREDEELAANLDPAKRGARPGSFGQAEEKPGENRNSQGQAPGAIYAREVEESPKPKKNPKAFTEPIRGPRHQVDRESIIVKGSSQALDETVEVRDGQVQEVLNDNTNVACILIESTRFSGYLVTAMGKNRKIDNQFIKTIQERLFSFLKASGEDLSDKENMQMKIKKVDFEDWALEYADFLRKSVHKGDEVAMAFFPRSDAAVEIKESAAQEMGSVSLKEIEPDKPVECNLYVYLPANNKYVLYTPKGGTFYGAQKDRLEKQGVKDLHILKAEVQDMTKYKAQNYLNNLIDQHQTNQKSKTKKPTGS
jgi:hypothetical protein